MRARLWLVGALLGLGCRPALAWGCKGHEVIALIAWAHLEPGVAKQVEAMLEDSPIPPVLPRRCRADFAGLPLMAQMASWADDVRDATTARYHYVDIPLGAARGGGALAAACQGDCATFAIAQYSRQLRTGASPQERAEALRYLIHLVGDLEQPLHAVDNADHGGNCVAARLPGAKHRTNLHIAWDSGLLATMMAHAGPARYAAGLDARFGRRFAAGSQDPAAWAWQSNALAARYAYGRLPIRIAPDHEAITSCRSRKVKLRLEVLDAGYTAQARPVIERQLDRGGWRLARLLNRLLAWAPARLPGHGYNGAGPVRRAPRRDYAPDFHISRRGRRRLGFVKKGAL